MKYAANISKRGIVRQVVAIPNNGGLAWLRANVPGKWVRTRRNGCAPNEYANVRDRYDKVTKTYAPATDEEVAAFTDDMDVDTNPQYDADELNDPANP